MLTVISGRDMATAQPLEPAAFDRLAAAERTGRLASVPARVANFISRLTLSVPARSRIMPSRFLAGLSRLGAAAVLLALTLATTAVHAAPPALADLDSYVHTAMTEWKVPGLAVAVVKDGRVVIARGYGVRELGKPARADADTLFDIGSNTKAFTAAALGTLVAAGKLRWDDPVVTRVPGFRLDSPYVTEEITLRDLLAHRSGYCDPFPMWYTSDDTTANIIERLKFQKATFGFRAHFCYDNATYMVAAQFVPAATGESWDRYVAARLFA